MAQARDPDRLLLEQRWLQLTRERLPAEAAARGWPVRADHCFQRILLDAACHGCWYDRIAGRPAFRHAPAPLLHAAVALAEACLDGSADLVALNRRSLAWRRGRGPSASVPSPSTALTDR